MVRSVSLRIAYHAAGVTSLHLAFNRAAAGRVNMCVAVSDDGGETWPHHHVFDDRTNPGTSYPNVAFGADAGGKYDGNIYVAYDHGRGKLKPDFIKEITVAKIPAATGNRRARGTSSPGDLEGGDARACREKKQPSG